MSRMVGVSAIARSIGASRGTIYHRIRVLGWSFERATTTPPRRMRKWNERGPCSTPKCGRVAVCKGLCTSCWAKDYRAKVRSGAHKPRSRAARAT